MARALIKTHSSSSIGSVKNSMLTEVQFQTEHGLGWVLMDGRDLTATNPGSDYETLTGFTSLPDARGQFLRGKNNGRSDSAEDEGGERALGNYQEDQFQGHIITTRQSGGGAASGGVQPSDGGSGVYDIINGATFTEMTPFGTPRFGAETRSKNVAINIFIKINEA